MKLRLDTASSLGWLALDNHVTCLPSGSRHSHQLAGAIKTTLDQHGLGVLDLSEIAVGRGPGSFTGIRVAAAVATGLHLGSRLPISTFCSLQGFAPEEDGSFVIAFDARGGGAYVLAGSRLGDYLSWEGESARMSLEALERLADGRDHVITPDQALVERLALPWCQAQPSSSVTYSASLDLCYLGVGRVSA